MSSLTKKLNEINELKKEYEYLLEIVEVLKEEEDNSLFLEFINLLNSLEKKCDEVYITTLLSGEFDELNAILTLHAGAGGTEAQDWAQMLYRMYTRYAERVGYKVQMLDYLNGETAGLKSVSFLVSGTNAYGYLKCEKRRTSLS